MIPPCHDCPNKGCGKQASCSRYMAFWNEKQLVYRDRKELSILNGYTKDAIRRAKSGRNSTISRYRSKWIGA